MAGFIWRVAAGVALFVVTLLSACGGGGGSDPTPAPPPPAANTAPTNVRLVEVASAAVGQITASWLPASDDTTSAANLKYQLHASTDSAFVVSPQTQIFEGTGQVSATISTGLTAGTKYFIRLVAIDQQGAQTVGDSMPVTVADTTATSISSATVKTLGASEITAMTPDSVTLAATATVPAVGTFIASSEGAGFLRKVTSVTTNGGQTTVTTSQASLGEVLSNVQISSSMRMTTIPTASVADARAHALSIKAGNTNAGGQSISWPLSGLKYSAGLSTPSNTSTLQRTGTMISAISPPRFEVGPFTTISGSWAKVLAPEWVALDESASNTVKINISTTTDEAPFFGSRVSICKVEVGPVTNADANAKPREVNAGLNGQLEVIQTEADTGRVKNANQALLFNATSGTASTSPYKMKVFVYLQDVDKGCKPSLIGTWRQKTEFEISIFIGNNAFPSSEKSSATFNASAGVSASSDIDISFDPILQQEFRQGAIGQLDYLRIKIDSSPIITQLLKIHANASGTIHDRHSLLSPASRKFYKIYMTSVGIPIVISGEFTLEMIIDGDVSGALDVTEELKFGFDKLSYGIECISGVCSPIEERTPKFSFRIGGSGKAEANLNIAILPTLKLSLYESATGVVALKPYATANAAVEGVVQFDAAIDPALQLPNLAFDADYRLTKATLTSGINAYLFADLKAFHYTLATWPQGAIAGDYTTYKNIELAQVKIAELPSISAAVDMASILPTDSRAIRIKTSATNLQNPWQLLFPNLPQSLISWMRWTTPKLIVPLGVPDTSYSILPSQTGDDSEVWVIVTKPGNYTVRLGGFNSWGTWARQYIDVPLTISDSDGDGILDYLVGRPPTSPGGSVNIAPVASFLLSPSSATVGQSVALDASGSVDSDGSITSYAWDFGDQQSASSTAATQSHSYSSAGTYTVTLTVTDNQGSVGTASKSILVQDTQVVVPSISSISPTSMVSNNTVQQLTINGANFTSSSIVQFKWGVGAGANIWTNSIQTPGIGSTQILVGMNPGTVTDSIAVRVCRSASAQSAADCSTGALLIDIIAQASSATYKINDTGIGQNQCYMAGSNTLVSCTSAEAIALNAQQDGMIGRDVSSPNNADGNLGFNFSTVGNYPVTDCVKDNVTGLIWEGKTATGMRAGSNVYTNYDDIAQATQAQIDAASNSIGYLNAVNASALCGYTDWRLPTEQELMSLVDYSVLGNLLAIDQIWFPNTPSYVSAFWSSTQYINNVSKAVYVGSGAILPNPRSSPIQLRLVR